MSTDEIGSPSRAGRGGEPFEESFASKHSCEYHFFFCLWNWFVSSFLLIAFLFVLQRYLGTAREDESLNILLEFVPGGSISSLLGKFGSFPESVSYFQVGLNDVYFSV